MTIGTYNMTTAFEALSLIGEKPDRWSIDFMDSKPELAVLYHPEYDEGMFVHFENRTVVRIVWGEVVMYERPDVSQ